MSNKLDMVDPPSMEDLIDQLTDEGKLEVTLLASGVAKFRRDFNKARDQYRKALGEDADKRRSNSTVSEPFTDLNGRSLVTVTYTLAGERYKARMGKDYGIMRVN